MGQLQSGHSTRVMESQCGGVTATVTARPAEEEGSRTGVEEPDFWDILCPFSFPHTHLLAPPHTQGSELHEHRGQSGTFLEDCGKRLRMVWSLPWGDSKNDQTRVLISSIFLQPLSPPFL